MASHHLDLLINLTFSLGFCGLPKKKRVRFLFEPDDFWPPKLLHNLDVFYLDCQWRGKIIDGEPHPNCLRGSAWPSCLGIWEIWGERWLECYVVLAISKPLEKWRKVQKLALCGIRGESTNPLPGLWYGSLLSLIFCIDIVLGLQRVVWLRLWIWGLLILMEFNVK